MKMKKVVSIVLSLVFVFALFACETKTAETPSPESSAPSTTDSAVSNSVAPPEGDKSSAFPNANADGTINLDTIAHFDRNYDYKQNEKYKVAYLAQAGGPLYQQSADAYEHWAPLYNMEWAGYISTNNDADLYLTSLQNLLDQGVRALILDPDVTIIPAVVDMLSKYPDVAWMTQMAAPRDGTTGDGIPPGGNMVNPYVGFDNYDAGTQVTKRLIQWKEDTYPDVPWSDFAFLCVDYSVVPPLHDRVMASEALWLETTGSTANFFVADTVSTGISLQGGLDAVGPVISTNTDYKYWICNGLIDDFALACSSILDQQGLTDTSCVITFGGSGLQMQWDQGQQDSFRYALFTAQNLYAEPIIGAVYAYLNGWATPDTIWPSWVKWDDHGGSNHTYPQLRLPTVWLEYDTYKHYLEWTDMYAFADAYPYSQDGININDYSPYIDVPADFKAP